MAVKPACFVSSICHQHQCCYFNPIHFKVKMEGPTKYTVKFHGKTHWKWSNDVSFTPSPGNTERIHYFKLFSTYRINKLICCFGFISLKF